MSANYPTNLSDTPSICAGKYCFWGLCYPHPPTLFIDKPVPSTPTLQPSTTGQEHRSRSLDIVILSHRQSMSAPGITSTFSNVNFSMFPCVTSRPKSFVLIHCFVEVAGGSVSLQNYYNFNTTTGKCHDGFRLFSY